MTTAPFQGVISDRVRYGIFGQPFLNDILICNYSVITKSFGANELVLFNQVHSDRSYVVTSAADFNRDGDGLITTVKNLVIGIKTADCVPLLMASDCGSIVASLHCGWRGALSNLIPNAIEIILSKLKSNKIIAVIGPCIHQESYKVDKGFYKKFLKEDKKNEKFFMALNDSLHFDLPGYVKSKLNKFGVSKISQINHNTYELEDLYPSYRRSSNLGKEEKKRMISAICIKQ